MLAQSLGTREPEALYVRWNRREIDAIEVKPLSEIEIEGFSAAPLDDAVDRLVPMLWTLVRTDAERAGELRRFAGFLSRS